MLCSALLHSVLLCFVYICLYLVSSILLDLVAKGDFDQESRCPRFKALEVMVENKCEICLRHSVAVKYVDRKWIQRGFRYTIGLILVNLLFHVCLMLYTTRVIVAERKRTKMRRKYFR